MVRRAAFVSLWVFATMLATGMGLAAVRGVSGEVVDQPASELLAIAPPTSQAAQPAGTGEGGSKLPPVEIGEAEGYAVTSTTEVPIVAAPSTDSDTDVATTAAEPGSDAGSTPTTSAAPVREAPAERPTSTTRPPRDDPPPVAGEATYQLIGGWVRLVYSDGVVQLDAAGPSSGYTMIINGNGPDRVNISFRSSDHLSRLRAEWRGGELDAQIIEESRGR